MIVVRGVWPGLVQSLVVNPTQQEKEKQYLAYNIEATRTAYNLDTITQQHYPLEGDLTPPSCRPTTATAAQHPALGPEHAADQLSAAAGAAQYYNFTDVDVDRYRVNGVYRETMLSAREFDIDGLHADDPDAGSTSTSPTRTVLAPWSRPSIR